MGLFDFLKRKPEEETPTKQDQPTNASASEEQTPEATSEATADTKPTEPKEAPSEAKTEEPTADSAEASETTSAAPSKSDEQATDVVAETSEVADTTATPDVSAEPVAESVSEATSEKPDQPTDQATTDSAQDTPAENEVSATPETEADRYDRGLTKTRVSFGERLNRLLANFRSVDESFFDDLEETLIGADVGYETAMTITDELRDEVKLQNAKKSSDVQKVVVEKLIALYNQAGEGESSALNMAATGPTVILFVGVNGVGKTTTIGKMANRFKQQGKKVLLAAADTFRAGAIEQLNEWAIRDGVDIVKKPEKSDPSAVVFDAVQKAKAENYDVLFVDTAGRLQNKANLMNELAKMKRVISREIPEAPHEVLIVLDATTGQNALNQTKLFKETTDVTGIVLTKLDGTARGGIVLAIRNEMHLPVKYVGLGEKVGDLRPFNSEDFVQGLFKGLLAD